MVTRRLAETLLRTAARRWPVAVRDELAREWAAELHVLDERGQRWRMLRFAASLAARRAGGPVVDRAVLHRQLRRTAGVLLLAPPGAVAAVALAATVMTVVYGTLTGYVAWADRVQVPLWTVLTAGLGALLALPVARAARRTVRTGPLATALGVLLPIGATGTLVLWALVGRHERDALSMAPGVLLWLALLAGALWAAGALARRGRTRWAWLVGLVGALVAADAAVVLAVVTSFPAIDPAPLTDGAASDAVSRVSAPLWLLDIWTDSSLGLPRPTEWERFLITDRIVFEPMLYLACTPYAVAYAIAVARRPADPVPAADPVPSVV
ncbi:hypothetical protein [Micromonospora auratinigra]|uniref:Uncharacterized protein n=1 Tax=Micromonospora auratinigra TaxID=261654 RepID=A0A1A8ZN26_9ACTN|nr:hypothetical protein [Micromonospora auratinigra]SBT45264.1 hypothetical protein GA0070611_2965 [Micromonospora auratinigra]